MVTLNVALGARAYPIHLVGELPNQRVADVVGERATLHAARRALIITDSHVGPLYAGGVVSALEGAGKATEVLEIPAGEASKSLSQIGDVLDYALTRGVGRGDFLVALGGGVVGDIAGFSAAILHRGVSVLQVPTTLLAQVDSAVGGKTGVNHAVGKNLIGAFWQPEAVVSSQKVLETLPDRERRCGLAEALKHGLIADAPRVDWIVEHAAALRALETHATTELVAACCRIKAEVVASDERDHGRRAILNFGHTFGHAYELLAGYGALSHGEAVGLGMVLAARLSEILGVGHEGLENQVRHALRVLGLADDPASEERPGLDALVAAARSDKKSDGEKVRFVLLEKRGQALIRELEWSQIKVSLSDTFG